MFSSDPLPQVYKIKYLAMQSAFTDICERMGRFEELSEFKHGTVTGCHLCNKSVGDISSLLYIPWPNVRPNKVTKQVQRVLRRKVHKSHQWSVVLTQ